MSVSLWILTIILLLLMFGAGQRILDQMRLNDKQAIITLVAIIMGVITAFRIGLDVILPEKSASQSSYDNDEMNRNENIIECFTTFSLVVSVIPVFIKHNKLAKEARKIKVEEIKIEESNH